MITQNFVRMLSKVIVRTASAIGSLQKCDLNGPISFSMYKEKSRELYKVFRNMKAICSFIWNLTWICGNKMPTRCNRGFYCRSYCLLNMFRGTTMPIIRSSRVLFYIFTARNTTGSSHCIILLSSWWWA